MSGGIIMMTGFTEALNKEGEIREQVGKAAVAKRDVGQFKLIAALVFALGGITFMLHVNGVLPGGPHRAAPVTSKEAAFRLRDLPTGSDQQSYHGGDLNSEGDAAGAVPGGACLWRPLLGWYRRTDLGTLPGCSDSTALALNHRDTVVGYAATQVGGQEQDRAFLWRGGAMRPLPSLPGLPCSTANAVNDTGQVAGRAFAPRPGQPWWQWPARAVLWDPQDHPHDLGLPPGALTARASALNRMGEAAGWVLVQGYKAPPAASGSGLPASGMRACLWAGGRALDLGLLPGGHISSAKAINNAGMIAGDADDAQGRTHAVIWQRQGSAGRWAIQDLGFLAGSQSCKAFDVNDQGQVLGDVQDQMRLFVWDARRGMRTISLPDDPGWTLQRSIALNDRGQVLCAGVNNTVNETYNQRIFLLTPEQ